MIVISLTRKRMHAQSRFGTIQMCPVCGKKGGKFNQSTFVHTYEQTIIGAVAKEVCKLQKGTL